MVHSEKMELGSLSRWSPNLESQNSCARAEKTGLSPKLFFCVPEDPNGEQIET